MAFGRKQRAKTDTTMPRVVTEFGPLALRLGAGGLLAGHGAQKLFGAFGGNGLDGTANYLGSLGLKPAGSWALMAGISEFGGGALMALGLGGPIGPIVLQGAMVNAIRQGRGKPIWAAQGGAEAAVLYSLIGLAYGTAGPGRHSLDNLLGVKVPTPLVVATLGGVAAGLAVSVYQVSAAKANAAAAPDAAADAAADDTSAL